MSDATITTELSPADKIKAVCVDLGLTMTAEFVPFSKSRNAVPRNGADKPWKSLNWKVTLRVTQPGTRTGTVDTGRDILTTDYGQGVAHCPSYNDKRYGRPGFMSVDRDKAVTYEIETGRVYVPALAQTGTRKVPDPSIVDVVASLVLDSSVLDAASFEDWAADYGYDTDSRSAETTYRECLAVALKLRNGIGEAGLTALREACQDY